MTGELTGYDVVPYTTGARTAAYAGRIATLGRLLGMETAHPNGCRVLELGCGDGGNLLPMAVSLPGSEFVGIDLAGTAIERGRKAIAQIGVTNVSLRQADLREAGADLGEFDYVIAHGVYSWVPADVRRALLKVVRDRLTPQGLAFVSYNAMPGDHIRGVVRQMMRMHTADIREPRRKIQQARALLALLAQMPGEAGDVYRPLVQSEIGKALQNSDDLLFHDDLADISQPFFFSEFMHAAQSEGLQFACEAVFHSMSVDVLPTEIAAMLRELGDRDLIAKEQYLDFLTCRGFRQTLLCREDAVLHRDIDLDRIRQFRFSTDARRVDETPQAGGIAAFSHRNGSVLRTDSALAIAALTKLSESNPRSIPFADLALAAGAFGPADEEVLAEVLFRGFSAGVLEFCLYEPASVLDVNERPMASPWARFRAEVGRVPNLYHEVIELDDASKALLPLLDGTRTVPDIATATGREDAAVAATVRELAQLGLLLG